MASKSIPFSFFVDVTSKGISPTFTFNRLNALVITNNLKAEEKKIYEFYSAQEVADFFGSTSPEYRYAQNFFSYISKNGTKPERLSFYFWNNNASIPYSLQGGKIESLAQTQLNGSFSITINANQYPINLDLQNITSFNDIVTAIQPQLPEETTIEYNIELGSLVISNINSSVFYAEPNVTDEIPATKTTLQGTEIVSSEQFTGKGGFDIQINDEEVTVNLNSNDFITPLISSTTITSGKNCSAANIGRYLYPFDATINGEVRHFMIGSGPTGTTPPSPWDLQRVTMYSSQQQWEFTSPTTYEPISLFSFQLGGSNGVTGLIKIVGEGDITDISNPDIDGWWGGNINVIPKPPTLSTLGIRNNFATNNYFVSSTNNPTIEKENTVTFNREKLVESIITQLDSYADVSYTTGLKIQALRTGRNNTFSYATAPSNQTAGTFTTIQGNNITADISLLKTKACYSLIVNNEVYENKEVDLTSINNLEDIIPILNASLPQSVTAKLENETQIYLIAPTRGSNFTISYMGNGTNTTLQDLSTILKLSQEQGAISIAGTDPIADWSQLVGLTQGKGASITLGINGLYDLSAPLCLTEATGAVLTQPQQNVTISQLLKEIEDLNGNYVSISTIVKIPDSLYPTISQWTKSSLGRYLWIAITDNSELIESDPLYPELLGNDGFILNYNSNQLLNAFTQAAIASVDLSATNGMINFNFIPADNYENETVIDSGLKLTNLNKQRANGVYRIGGYGQNQLLYGEGNIWGSNFSDISGYVGNTWLVANLQIAGCNLFISTPFISLRGNGSNLLLNTLQSPILNAKNGGVIVAVGQGNLTQSEKSAIINITNNNGAIDLIEQNGYFLQVLPITDENIKTKTINVLLIYTRNIPINRVVIQNFILGS